MDGYRFGPTRIDFETDDRDSARWLREFLLPWFEACPPGAGGFRVRLARSAEAIGALAREQALATLAPRACFALDSQVALLPGWTDATGAVVADERRHCFLRLRPGGVEIVAQPGIRRARIALLRAVREIAALRMRREPGCLDLHASAFAAKDRAVLLIGPKRAGKTTLLASSLASGRASLLANDRVFVETTGAGLAHGVPTLVSVRPDTLERFPSLASSVAGGPALLHAAEVEAWTPGSGDDATPLKYSLSPAQLAQQLGAGVLRCAPIAAIVFPEIDAAQAHWSLAPLAPEAAAARLRENLYGARRVGPRPPTLFEAIVDGPARPEPDPAPALARLAASAPAFTCRLGPDAYQGGAEPWLRALGL